MGVKVRQKNGKWYVFINHLSAPARNFATITGFKIGQSVLQAQWCIDALS